jgi:hypothetical protein
MADEELLSLGGDAGGLADTAQAALNGELAKRGLSLEVREEKASAGREIQGQETQVSKRLFGGTLPFSGRLNLSELRVMLGLASDPTLSRAEQDPDNLLPDEPVRGWLAFFASYLIIGAVIALILHARGNASLTRTFYDGFHDIYLLLVINTIFWTGLLALAIYAGIALWAKWANCVRLARVALTATLIYTCITFWAYPYVLDRSHVSIRLPLWTMSEILEMLWCVGWLVYLRKSR